MASSRLGWESRALLEASVDLHSASVESMLHQCTMSDAYNALYLQAGWLTCGDTVQY